MKSHLPLCIALTVLLSAVPARGITLITTFGPNDSYDPVGGWGIAKNINGTNEHMMGFVPAFDVALDSIRLAVLNAGGLNELDVWLMDATYSILEAFHFSNAMFADDGFQHAPLQATSSLHPLLHGGQTYWLAASQAGNSSNSSAVWKFNSQEIFGLLGSRPYGSWTARENSFPFPQGAFAINATPLTAPVSDGGNALFLLCIVLSGFGVLKTRTRGDRNLRSDERERPGSQ